MLSCLSGCFLVIDGVVAVLFYLLFDWFGLSTVAIVGACIIAIPILVWLLRSGRSSAVDRHEIERNSPPCLFEDGISQNEFEQLAYKIAKRIKRLHVSIRGSTIYGEVESQSGISTWEFEVDFNDNGHITGKWWMIQVDNRQSNIPDRFAELMEQAIKERLEQL